MFDAGGCCGGCCVGGVVWGLLCGGCCVGGVVWIGAGVGARIAPKIAQVAELVDALASGASDRKIVEVRVFSWAPNLNRTPFLLTL